MGTVDRAAALLITTLLAAACGPTAADIDDLFAPSNATRSAPAAGASSSIPAAQATIPSAPPTPEIEFVVAPDVAKFAVWVPLGRVLGTVDFDVAAGLPVADPTVAQLSDGSLRMYVFAQNQGIRSAVSDDGIDFRVEEGLRIDAQGFGMPRITPLDEGGWRLYGIHPGGIGSAVSADGLTFELEAGLRVEAAWHGVEALSVGSIVPAPQGGFRMYYSDLPRPGVPPTGHTIFSSTSSDGIEWTPDESFRFGAADESDLANSAEHPFVLRDAEGLYWMFFFRQFEIWAASSVDGITWQNESSTGLRGNDPEVVVRRAGEWWMYYGDFDAVEGGFIQVGKRVWTTWDVNVSAVGGGAGFFSFAARFEGFSEKPLAVSLAGAAGELPAEIRSLPNEIVFDLPSEALLDPSRNVELVVSDGSVERRLSLVPPPPGTARHK